MAWPEPLSFTLFTAPERHVACNLPTHPRALETETQKIVGRADRKEPRDEMMRPRRMNQSPKFVEPLWRTL
jgi:hypothetical protein